VVRAGSADALSAKNLNMFFGRPTTMTSGEPPRRPPQYTKTPRPEDPGAAHRNLRVTSLKNLGTLHIPGFVATHAISRGRCPPGNALSISPARSRLAGALVSTSGHDVNFVSLRFEPQT
jgi:hypothetical protein